MSPISNFEMKNVINIDPNSFVANNFSMIDVDFSIGHQMLATKLIIDYIFCW